MTEKRFVYIEHKGADYILDTPNWELDFIEMLGDTLEAEEIVDLLNDLTEENEQLKSSNLEYEDALARFEEKNQQLKKELKRCKDWINSDKNDYELTLAFIKNKGYSLKDVLEYEKELKSE